MRIIFPAFLVFSLALTVSAQEKGELDRYNLDAKPFDPKIDPDSNLFVRNWRESPRRTVFGALSEWDILTPGNGDSERPKTRGAVLTVIKGLTYAVLEPGKATTPATLGNEQKVFYFVSGRGTLTGGRNFSEVREGIGALVPPGISFTIKNTGGETLSMYIITEPVPDGFTPNPEITFRDERGAKWSSNNGHWSHNSKHLFEAKDGLAALTGMGAVWFLPGTLGQPHTHGDPVEEIWFAISGDATLLLGKQYFHLPPGTAYKIPPTGYTGHSNINASDQPIKMFWMMRSVKPVKAGFRYGTLDPAPYDPKTESRIDMFISGYKEHMQYSTHGTLLERDMFTRNEGDPVRPTDRGSVLRFLDRFTYATLMEGDRTAPTTLKDTQELFYITGGRGTVTGGGRTYGLYPGVAFLIPKGLEFVMENTANTPLCMYLIAEKADASFTPAGEIVWQDENLEPFHPTPGHWAYETRWLYRKQKIFSQIGLFLTITLQPGTFAQPHSHDSGTEEIWAPLDGRVHFMLGKQLRTMEVGQAHYIPPDGKTPHANFNPGDKPVKLFYVGLFGQK